MKTSFSSKKMIERLAAAKLDGVTVKEMFELVKAEGATVSIHWFRKVWTALPKRKSVATMQLETSIASRIQALQRLGLPVVTGTTNQPQAETPQPSAAPPTNSLATKPVTPTLPVPTLALAAKPPTKSPLVTSHKDAAPGGQVLSKEEALQEIEDLLRRRFDPDFSLATWDKPSTASVFEALQDFATTRSELRAGTASAQARRAVDAMTLSQQELLDKRLATPKAGVEAGKSGGILLRQWLIEAARQFPKI